MLLRIDFFLKIFQHYCISGLKHETIGLSLASRFCTPPEVKFDAFDTSKHGKGKSLWKKTFLLHLSAHWGDLIEQIKKICHIHFKYHIGDLNLSRKWCIWESAIYDDDYKKLFWILKGTGYSDMFLIHTFLSISWKNKPDNPSVSNWKRWSPLY